MGEGASTRKKTSTCVKFTGVTTFLPPSSSFARYTSTTLPIEFSSSAGATECCGVIGPMSAMKASVTSLPGKPWSPEGEIKRKKAWDEAVEGARCESSVAENRRGGSSSESKVQGTASKPIGPP